LAGIKYFNFEKKVFDDKLDCTEEEEDIGHVKKIETAIHTIIINIIIKN